MNVLNHYDIYFSIYPEAFNENKATLRVNSRAVASKLNAVSANIAAR